MMTDEKHNERIYLLNSIDRLIHEPARFMIMAHLFVIEEADFIFLMRHTGLTKGNLSAHLSKLEAAGYITIEKEFIRKKTRTMLSLTTEGRAAFGKYHESMTKALGGLSVDRDGK